MQSKQGIFLSLAFVSSLTFLVIYCLGTFTASTATRDALFNQQVRNAIAELARPQSDDPDALAVGAGNLSGFMTYRAGVLLSDSNLKALAKSEGQSLRSTKRITKDQLADALTSIAIGKLRDLDEDRKWEIVDSMRGFDHPDLPESFRRSREFVSIRANGKGRMSADSMSTQIDAISGTNANSKVVSAMIRNAIALEIGKVCEILTAADSNFFSGTKCDMTPIQAVLVSYAVVTDDLLAGNRADIQERMLSIHSAAEASAGMPYPGPEGQIPYGPNGYVFSTPSQLLLDDSAVADLISFITRITR